MLYSTSPSHHRLLLHLTLINQTVQGRKNHRVARTASYILFKRIYTNTFLRKPENNSQLSLDLVVLPNFTFPPEHLAFRLLPLCPLPPLPPRWRYQWRYRRKHHPLRRRRQRRHGRCSRCQISRGFGKIMVDPKHLSVGNLRRRRNRLKRA